MGAILRYADGKERADAAYIIFFSEVAGQGSMIPQSLFTSEDFTSGARLIE